MTLTTEQFYTSVLPLLSQESVDFFSIELRKNYLQRNDEGWHGVPSIGKVSSCEKTRLCNQYCVLNRQFFVHFKGVHIPRSPFHIISKLKSVIIYQQMSIHGKNWNRQITARLISKNKVRVVLTCYRVHHVYIPSIVHFCHK